MSEVYGRLEGWITSMVARVIGQVAILRHALSEEQALHSRERCYARLFVATQFRDHFRGQARRGDNASPIAVKEPNGPLIAVAQTQRSFEHRVEYGREVVE